MAPSTRGTPDVPVDVVVAARAGDAEALDRLVAQSLPLVYNVVGRALDGHPDTDDVVQESVLRVVRGIGSLEQEQSFRSWMLAITVRQVRDWMRHRRVERAHLTGLAAAELTPDPAADFVTATVDQLFLDGERRRLAEATRWLDPQDRDVLALWWLEASGGLTRVELARSLGVDRRHAAVRVQRMRERLATGLAIVAALESAPRCPGLVDAARRWDGIPAPLWRKRLSRHVRGCASCSRTLDGGADAERLLAGLPLLVPPGSLAGLLGGSDVTPGSGPTSVEHVDLVPRGGAGAVEASRGRPGRSWWARPRLATSVVAGVVAVVVGVVVSSSFLGAPGATPVGPASAAADARVPAPVAVTPTGDAETAEHAVVGVVPAAPEGTSTTDDDGTAVDGPAPAVQSGAAPSGRKGAAVWEFADAAPALTASDAAWYYTWDTDPGPGAASGVEFVPMIWGRDDVTDENLARAAGEGDHLLGFNEPDLAGQAEMSVEEALDLWPRLESTGQALGSPAVAWGGDHADGWLDRFMRGAEQHDRRVDFVTLHWYGGDFDAQRATAQLRDYLEAVHARYDKPVWLTEFALIDFSDGVRHASDAEQAAFLTEATRMLADLDYVQRYAWFGLPAEQDVQGTGLYLPGPVATPVGRAFEAAP
ncbi:sigma-70 family RNA polymerase sigma factor [Cellulosimicrobium terreum]|nr:sigma-70 family RNA polymerase sigma factor [Cellulosimicrobium terreum]